MHRNELIEEIIEYDENLVNIDFSEKSDRSLKVLLEIVQLREELKNKTQEIADENPGAPFDEIFHLCVPLDEEYTARLEVLCEQL